MFIYGLGKLLEQWHDIIGNNVSGLGVFIIARQYQDLFYLLIIFLNDALIIRRQLPVLFVGEHIGFIFLQESADFSTKVSNARLNLIHLAAVGIEHMGLDQGM